mmetsp:Transcript_9314/g.20154  ORF Transcript_9314/g.20154 Transcript_9314/m.20154 type:complete len:321 (+) Transcript_9314:906-1868(+)
MRQTPMAAGGDEEADGTEGRGARCAAGSAADGTSRQGRNPASIGRKPRARRQGGAGGGRIARRNFPPRQIERGVQRAVDEHEHGTLQKFGRGVPAPAAGEAAGAGGGGRDVAQQLSGGGADVQERNYRRVEAGSRGGGSGAAVGAGPGQADGGAARAGLIVGADVGGARVVEPRSAPKEAVRYGGGLRLAEGNARAGSEQGEGTCELEGTAHAAGRGPEGVAVQGSGGAEEPGEGGCGRGCRADGGIPVAAERGDRGRCRPCEGGGASKEGGIATEIGDGRTGQAAVGGRRPGPIHPATPEDRGIRALGHCQRHPHVASG